MKKNLKFAPDTLAMQDLDIALVGGDVHCSGMIQIAAKRLKQAQSPEQCARFQQDIRHWNELELESRQWRRLKTIEPIGDLYQHTDGRFRVVLTRELTNTRHGFIVTGESDPGLEEIRRNLALIMEGGLGLGHIMDEAMLAWHGIQEGLGKRLRSLKTGTPSDQLKAAKRLKNDLAKAVDRIAKPSLAPARSNATGIKVKDEHGQERSIRVEILAIDMARHLAEVHQDAPAKGDIQAALCREFPMLEKSPPSTWTAIWKRCGLNQLPTAAKWSLTSETTS